MNERRERTVAVTWRDEQRSKERLEPGRAGRLLAWLTDVLGRVLSRIPPVRRALARSPVGRSSAVLRRLQQDNAAAAFQLALAEMRRTRPLEQAPLEPCGFWHFAKLAVFAAGELADPAAREARDEILRELEHEDVPLAQGIEAARTLLQVSKWTHAKGRTASAILLARKAIAADATWPESRVVLAWYGIQSGKLDPLPLLREAIALDPAALPRIVGDPAFRKVPGLVEELTRPRPVAASGSGGR